ncbi:WD domain, G-beta repeat protein [Ancylostoma ceylanicum]|uniref:WD domain, G-beta repeat protein n=1 Tax=Ancylostoma ceylanicum TaxID=53326 RepID=A0A0D6MBV3_9BILA|nr:WD domain, G-beta repeat protein [Ancylostoma ceylanicum]
MQSNINCSVSLPAAYRDHAEIRHEFVQRPESEMFRRGSARRKSAVAPVEEAPPPSYSPLSTKIYVVYGDSEEFALERQMLWMDMLPELQSYAFHSGFDIEWIDPLSERGHLNEVMVDRIMDGVEAEDSWLICLLGDKYGTIGPPNKMLKEEFDAIRAAVFEQSSDLKLLDQHYVVDRTAPKEEYRLNTPLEDEKLRAKLAKVVQKGAKSAYDDGTMNQVNSDRQRRFFWSPIHTIAAVALERNARCTMVLRKFDNVRPDTGMNSTFCDKSPETAEKIAKLKNEVSEKIDSKLVFSHIFSPENGDIGSFFTSREGDKYRDTLLRQILERLKTHLVLLHPTIPSSPHTVVDIAAADNDSHLQHYGSCLKRPWYAREAVDAKLKELLSAAASGGVFLVQGPELCGKTRALCHLYEQAPPTCYKIIRFIDLTYSSVFAHEVWRKINLQLCALSGKSPQNVVRSFNLEEQLTLFDGMLEGLDKMLYLFLDDMHLLKNGPFMSTIEKRAPSTLAIFMTASNVSPISSFYTVTQTYNMDVPNEQEIIEIVKKSVVDRNVSSDQWATIKQQLTGSNRSILVAEVLLDQVLQRRNGVMSGGIQGRLERIEAELGVLPVQSFCMYTVLATHGLTRLELYDLLSSNIDLIAKLGVSAGFPPLLLDRIIESFGSLLQMNFVDQRTVYRLSHSCLNALFRTRYFTSLIDLKTAHGEIADYFGSAIPIDENISPRKVISYQPFPQQMNRENGLSNVRRLHNLWFHLLHTGNMDALKEMALCQFEFIDSAVHTCGMVHLLSMYEECAMQVIHHDLQVLCEQVLIPAIPTVLRDREQLAAEVIGRLRYTRAENSHFLNTLVEQAMTWVDNYTSQPLLVPLSCWIAPPVMKRCRTFTIKDWKAGQTVLAPTFNHQHVLISGNQSAIGVIYMYHIAAQSLMTTFNGHTGNVTSLSCSTSGAFFVSTSVDKSVRIWSLINGDCLKVLTPHTHKVTCSILASDDSFLVTGSSDSSAKVIDIESGEVLRSFTEHTGSVVSLQLTMNNQFLITGSGDFIVQMWSLLTGRCISRMGGLMAPVSCITITSNDAFVAVACEDETLRVFSTVSGQELHELMGHEGRVNALVCAQDDCQLFAATKSKIYCYDIHNGQIVDTLDCQLPHPVYNIKKRNHDALDDAEHMGFVTAIALSSDDKIAACGTYDGVVAVWDLDICQCISTVPQSKGIPVSCLAFSFNQTFLLSGNAIGNISNDDARRGATNFCSAHGKARDWSLSEEFERTTYGDDFGGVQLKLVGFLDEFFLLHSTEIVSICCLENYRVLSCDKEGKLCQWEIFGDEESLVIVWNVSTGDIAHSLVCSAPLTAVSLSSDGSVAFSASEDGWLEAWSTEKGTLLSSFNAHRPIRQVLNSLDANRLLVQLSSCAQLPILCLHNSPAGSHPQVQRRRSARAHSITSLGNDNPTPTTATTGLNVETKVREGASSSLQVGNGHSVQSRSAQPRPTFDKLDRGQSRSSVIEKYRGEVVFLSKTGNTFSSAIAVTSWPSSEHGKIEDTYEQLAQPPY